MVGILDLQVRGTQALAKDEHIFAGAFAELVNSETGLFGPVSFRDYAKKTNYKLARKTPAYISIDHYERLRKPLRDAEAMVPAAGRLRVRRDNTVRADPRIWPAAQLLSVR